MRLGVNIDHVATVRQARRTVEPDPVAAAVLAELGGADSIVIHLREDRRHIQERDLRLLRESVATRLNLEMALSDDVVRVALEVRPHQVTIVPERREELTTEGGLDVRAGRDRLVPVIQEFRRRGVTVSLFVDPDRGQIEQAKMAGAEIVEIHTGTYANARGTEDAHRAFLSLLEAVRVARNLRLGVAAGHGLTYRNVGRIARIHEIEELNIGHSIVARAVLVGLERAVREMRVAMRGGFP